MTPEELREIDRKIARQVFGREICACSDSDISRWQDDVSSKSIKSGAIGYYFQTPARFGSDGDCGRCGNAYLPALSYSSSIADVYQARIADHLEYADTAPLAICLAALKAVEGKD